LIEELNAAAASQAARLAELEQRLQAAERTAAWASADSSGTRAQVAALQEALRSREARRGLWETIWREADAEIAATSAASRRLSGELEQAMARIAVLERELAESRAATEAARRELTSVSGERDQVSQRLTSAETALGARSGELEVQRQRGDALTSQLDTATREAATLRDELAETRRALQAELDTARAAQAQLRDALQVAEARAHHLEVELSLKNARLEARHAFEARREEVSRPPGDAVAFTAAAPAAQPPGAAPSAPSAPVAAPPAAAPPRTADVLPLDLPGSPQRVARREPELLPEGAPRYLILSEGNAETVFRLGRRTTIGRADDNDIAIMRASISRHHAVIVSGPRQSVIEDLNSTNGVFVNRQRVRETVLRDGDIVQIGKCRFRFTSRLRSSGKP
jgi:predicted  nucleic acid-binding Zn-ribbon protein